MLSADQWAVDCENSAAVEEDGGYCRNDQSGASPDTEGAGYGLLKSALHHPDCDYSRGVITTHAYGPEPEPHDLSRFQ